ncbi:MAG: MFS transporter [Bacteroidales bacterium]|nr:MFS transporter [Bacteroidales bacterium]
MNQSMKGQSPWKWIPTLYSAEGLPYVAVMTVAVILYKRMGISNTDIALYTSWLYLPWVIKPFWSPFVDLLKTKRWWIITMQLFIGAGFAGIAFTIPLPFFFQATLAFFWLLAFSSATHDIAADGFYMLALDTNTQAKFVGIRSTFYRVATIIGQGLLIILAGFIESNTGSKPIDFKIEVSPKYVQVAPQIKELQITDVNAERVFATDKNTIRIAAAKMPKDSVQAMIKKVSSANQANHFISAEKESDKEKIKDREGFWSKNISTPLGNWLKNNFGEKREVAVSNEIGNIAVVPVRMTRKPEAGKSVLLNTFMTEGNRSVSLIEGDHLSFNEKNWDKTAYLVFQIDSKLKRNVTATYKGTSGNIPFAWSITFFVMAGMFVFFSFYHRIALPKPTSDKTGIPVTVSSILNEFGKTFYSFFKKPHIVTALFFMLTFRFSEAQVLKLINPFLLDSREVGGLGLSTGEVGLVYGTIGILGLMLGGIIGGFAAAKGGLKKWIWPMTLSMLLTIVVFIFLSFSQTHNLLIINACVFIEQFGYGFGFTAYMLYLIYFSEGEHKTAHYAFCTGFMALGMMIPGMFSGWLQEKLGYNHFFIWAMISSIIPIIAVMLLKIDPEYGKATPKEER